MRQHLGNGVRVHDRTAFEPALAALAGKTVAVDPERSVAAIFEALEGAGAKIVARRDPSILPKAIKNEIEIAGHKAAQARDGAALTRFLHWLSIEAPKGGQDELSARPPSCTRSARLRTICATSASTRFPAPARMARSATIACRRKPTCRSR